MNEQNQNIFSNVDSKQYLNNLLALEKAINKSRKLKNLGIVLCAIGIPLLLIQLIGSSSDGKVNRRAVYVIFIFIVIIIKIISDYYATYKPMKDLQEELRYDVEEKEIKTSQVNIIRIKEDPINGHLRVANVLVPGGKCYKLETADGQTFRCNNLNIAQPDISVNFMAYITYYENTKVIISGKQV